MELFYISLSLLPPAIKNIKQWEGEIYSPFVYLKFNLICNLKLNHNASQLVKLEYLLAFIFTTKQRCYLKHCFKSPYPHIYLIIKERGIVSLVKYIPYHTPPKKMVQCVAEMLKLYERTGYVRSG